MNTTHKTDRTSDIPSNCRRCGKPIKKRTPDSKGYCFDCQTEVLKAWDRVSLETKINVLKDIEGGIYYGGR